jgi:hypothetical protein
MVWQGWTAWSHEGVWRFFVYLAARQEAPRHPTATTGKILPFSQRKEVDVAPSGAETPSAWA